MQETVFDEFLVGVGHHCAVDKDDLCRGEKKM